MKKMFSLLIITSAILANSCQAQSKVVGEIVNGAPSLTMDKTAILKSYNQNLLKASGIDGQFTDVVIKEMENKQYILVFSGRSYRSSLQLTNNAGKLAPTGTSCTTTDCSSEPHGCEVTYGTGSNAGTVYCSPCGNGGKCTKTSSSISLID
ncbi:MAG: hypothetical protein JNM88_02590 [Chitinophagaceae bacterium]|nr:hypothetical protein [Chitinophagaceae bacterium]